MPAVAQGGIVSLLAGISKSDASRISANYGSFLGGLAISFVLVTVNAALIYALARRRLKPLMFAGLAGLVLVIDTWIVDSHYIKSYPPPNQSFAADEVVNFLKRDSTQFRVFPLYYVDPATGMSRSDMGLLLLSGIQSVGGQHPNPLQNYMSFVGLEGTVMFQMPPNLLNRKFLDLLNTKYVVSVPLPSDLSRLAPGSQQTVRLLQQYVSEPGLTQVYASQQAVIYRNDSLLPRAFLVGRYEVMGGKDQTVARIKQPSFDPRKVVLLSENPGVPNSESDSAVGRVAVKSYDADRIVVEAELTEPGFLVLSENYHPDWKAWDNGRPKQILRAYQTLRAIPLTAGTHTVVLRYDSHYLKLGSALSLIAVLALVLVGVVSLIRPAGKARMDQPARRPSLNESEGLASR